MTDQTAADTGLANSPPHDIDEEVNDSINPNPDASSSETQGRPDDTMNLDGSADSNQLPASLQADAPTAADEVEARIPQKKDATLKEFLGKMDDYAPIVSRSVASLPVATSYILREVPR